MTLKIKDSETPKNTQPTQGSWSDVITQHFSTPPENRPWIHNIMLSSLDGFIARHKNESSRTRRAVGFACSTDFERLKSLVGACDAVLIGAQTLHSEEAAFFVNKTLNKPEPRWIVFTQSGSIMWQHSFWTQTALPKAVVFAAHSKQNFAAQEIQIPNTSETLPMFTGPLKDILYYLRTQWNIRHAALLGGGYLNALFWKEKLVDSLFITLAPCVLGLEHAPRLVSHEPPSHTLELLQCIAYDSFLYVDYRVKFC